MTIKTIPKRTEQEWNKLRVELLLRDNLASQKTISISEETHEALHDISKMNETYDDIILKCIQAYKKGNGLEGINDQEEDDE